MSHSVYEVSEATAASKLLPKRKATVGPYTSDSAIRDRLNGADTHITVKEDALRLSQVQEDGLVSWILSEDGLGRAPSRSQIQAFAQMMVSRTGGDEPIDKIWVDCFLDRREDVVAKLAVNATRVLTTNEEVLSDHISRLDNVIKEKSVGRLRIYNVGEHSLVAGGINDGKVSGSTISRYSSAAVSNARTWVSIIECVSAAGARLTPSVIFTGDQLQGQWLHYKKMPDWDYYTSETGWSNPDLFMNWFEHTFLSETKPQDPDLWRLLLLDQHRSHLNVELQYMAYINKVHLVFTPAAHSSPTTQPLYSDLFTLLKTHFYEQTRGFSNSDTSAAVQKRRFISAYTAASARVFTEKNIRDSFKAAGAYPTNKYTVVNQVKKRKRSPSPSAEVLLTPTKKDSLLADHLWYTPSSSKDVMSQLRLVSKNLDGNDRGKLHIAKKAGKEIDRKNRIIAVLANENRLLKMQNSLNKPTGRKSVECNPNMAHGCTDDIAKAHYDSKASAARYEDQYGPYLQEEALEIARQEKEDRLQEWQM